VAASAGEKARRLRGKPAVSFPEHLPITAKKDQIVQAIRENQVVIISGETGSGKSTQIPKMCLEAGRGISGKIACTQPRRIATIAIARRISEELGEEIGQSVGYKIRFIDRSSRGGYVKILTDGMLLAETQQDPRLLEYDTVIIDEAHERSLNIDFLLGILRTLLPKRPELRLIVASATIDTEKFSLAFKNAPVLEVSERLYPVEVEYIPVDPELEEEGESTYVDMAIRAVHMIRKRGSRGDVLIFMPTEQDILETCEKLEGRRYPQTTVLPLFARLSESEQQKVYSVKGHKIIVATNVAETSLTIPGIKYVIDTGLARISRYVPSSRTISLPISPISRSSADQRKGRCGRVEHGVCIRLYTREDYETRPVYTIPEILRANLAEVILRMISLKLGPISNFPFLDKPNPKSIKDGLDLLLELGAIVKDGKVYSLTEKGSVMARMPLDPKVSRMLLEAKKEDCVREVAIIASALSIQDPRERPVEKADQADQMHAPFKDPDSDFMSLINIWNRYHRLWETLKTQNKMRKFCKEHFLSFPRMREWIYIHEQISTILKEQNMGAEDPCRERNAQALYEGIHRSVLSGYLSNIAMKKEKNIYLGARGKEVMVFPGSSLFNKGTQWIVAAEMVKTSRLFARTAAKIQPHWLEALGGDLCKSKYSDPHWDRKRGEVRAYQNITLYGLPIVSRRPISYGAVNPGESHRIFVQRALVDGEVDEVFPFLVHNQALIEKITAMEAKLRRRDMLVGQDVLAEFYSRKLGGVSDLQGLKRGIREKGNDDFLKMTEEDLFLFRPDERALALYPDEMKMGGSRLGCSYRFIPGEEEDGVTVTIPSAVSSLVVPERLDWEVPGLLGEKIAALIRGLPKRYRKQLVPVSRAVDVILAEMGRQDKPLITALANFIHTRFGVDIPSSAWATVLIPEHLQMRFSVTDHEGKEIRVGRDPRILTRPVWQSGPEHMPGVWKEAQKQWEKTGKTSWDFGSLPESIPLDTHLIAFPALEPADQSVNLRLFPDHEKALEVHKKGVEVLFCLRYSKELRFLKRSLIMAKEAAQAARYFGGERSVEHAMYQSLVKRLFHLNIRTREDFHAHAEAVGPVLLSRGKEILHLTETVLHAYHQARSAVYGVEGANEANGAVQGLCLHIRKEMDRLVPRDFLDQYAPNRLIHLPRYLKAMQIRTERASFDYEKDRKKTAQVEIFIEALRDMVENLSSHASSEKKEAVEAFRWMVEEYKVSLFAQELKTQYPISKNRLEEKLGEIERMV